VGFVLAVRLDLPEPLAYALVIAAFLALEEDRHWMSWTLYGLAIFTKEVVILFVAAQLLIYLWRNQWRKTLGMAYVTLIPYAIFQIWLWNVFGDFGIGSGGAMATSFEWIPFMGLWRIGAYSLILLLGYLVVFVPFVIFPALWGLWEVGKKFLDKDINRINLALGLHAASILFLPFSTFREPGGLLRYTCGLVLAVILFAAQYQHQRALRYVPLWLVLNVFLLKS
jgi:hypothetical protein